MITTIAGGGSTQGDGGPAISANLTDVNGIAVDPSGSVYLADSDRNLIRKIRPNGIITTIAGTGVAGNAGDGGPAIAAQLNAPGQSRVGFRRQSVFRRHREQSRAHDHAGRNDRGFCRNGTPAHRATAARDHAQLNNPVGVAVDKAGTVYISDAAGVVRAVTADGSIQTIAGLGADPADAGFSGDGGTAVNAEFNNPGSLTVDQHWKGLRRGPAERAGPHARPVAVTQVSACSSHRAPAKAGARFALQNIQRGLQFAARVHVARAP